MLRFPRKKLLLLGSCKSSLEPINLTADIDKLLLAGEERMALRANFNADFSALGGSGLNRFAARALDDALFVAGMDSVFHDTFYLVR